MPLWLVTLMTYDHNNYNLHCNIILHLIYSQSFYQGARLSTGPLPTHADNVRRLVKRQMNLVVIDSSRDVCSGWIFGKDLYLMAIHEVEDLPDALDVVGMDPGRGPVVVVEGDHRRMEQGEGFR